MKATWLLLVLSAGVLPAWAQPPVTLHNRAQLKAVLEKGSPCCVIDARPEGLRALRPLADALIYRPGMKLNPTAAVAVIAETDEIAMRVGAEVARTSKPPQVIVVAGGLVTWESVTAAHGAATGSALTFVIPRNTCEQDAPLQTLRAAPPAAHR